MRKTGTKRRNAFFVEIIIVILFFSLSVVVSLELFLQGHTKSVRSEQKNMALIRAQSAVELVRGYDPSGDEALSTVLPGVRLLPDGTGSALYYDREWNPAQREDAAFALTVRLAEEDTGAGRLVSVAVDAIDLSVETGGVPEDAEANGAGKKIQIAVHADSILVTLETAYYIPR